MNWEQLTSMGKEKLLDAIGLEERRSTSGKVFSTLGIFAFGAIVGGAVALLLAPQNGEEFRKEISERFTKLTGIGGDSKDESTTGTASARGNMGATARTGSTTNRPTSSA